MATLFLSVGLFLLILLGAPIALAMIVLPAVYILYTGAAPLLTIPYQMYEAVAKPALIAIPFFMLTGELMNSSTVTERIMQLSRSMVGRMRGGLGQVNVVSSMFFAGMNGSAVADTATIGSILIPAMMKSGYSPAFAAGLTAAGSTIGGIIPPSIMMIILASVANLSVGAMFAAGIAPGILIGLLFMAAVYWISVRRNYERGEQPFRLSLLWRAFLRASGALIVPVALLGGMLGGWFSSVEAGAVTAVVALFIGGVVYRDLSVKALFAAIARTARLTAAIFVIVAASGPFGWLMAKVGTVEVLQTWLLGFSHTPVVYAFVVVGLILLVGTFLDAPANIILLGPLLVSSSVAAGFHPVTSALVVVVGFLIGMIMPPLGTCWFLATRIAGARLEQSAAELMPFIAVETFVMLLMFAVPALTLAIPHMLGL
jgi:tripartite ATP-independent transporter DctM subunit